MAEAARKANYSTIHIGKWHLGDFFKKENSARYDRNFKTWMRPGPVGGGIIAAMREGHVTGGSPGGWVVGLLWGKLVLSPPCRHAFHVHAGS